MSKINPTCRVCGIKLINENWSPSRQKGYEYICKECHIEQVCMWRKANPKKVQAYSARWNRKMGMCSFNENKDCSLYFGIYVAERVLRHSLKNVEVMPMHNPGYDFICNKGMKTDVKSSCLYKTGGWVFHINHNTKADYFLCLAFDNRDNLNPLHVWLLPGKNVNQKGAASIKLSTIHKWDQYKLDISKVTTCCDVIRHAATTEPSEDRGFQKQ